MIQTAFQWWCNVMGALHNVTGYHKMCPGVTSLTPRVKLLKMQEAPHSLEAVTGKLSLVFNNWAGFVTTQPQWGQTLRYETLPPLVPARLILLLPFVTTPGTWAQKKKGTKSTSGKCCAPSFGGWLKAALIKPEPRQEGLTFHQSGMPGTGAQLITVCPETGRAHLRAWLGSENC